VRAVGELPAIAPTATDEDGVLLAGGHDGGEVEAEHFTGTGMQGAKQGLYQLEDVDLFNLLVIPPLARAVDVPDPLWADALAYATERRAMLLIDPPGSWNRPDQAITGVAAMASLRSPNSILYFPRVQMADPLRDKHDRHLCALRNSGGAFFPGRTPNGGSGKRRPGWKPACAGCGRCRTG
jgi:hypothetical protein